jgi:exopolysaccharide biosynthesis polyprenyl glycosylphosphotransferase
LGDLESAYDLLDGVDEHTRRLVRQRQSSSRSIRRGWLLHRSLLVADMIGLLLAFLGVVAIYGRGGMGFVLLLLALPGWVALAKPHDLYHRDGERADNSTADEVVGVFRLLTIGMWLLIAGSVVFGVASPDLQALIVLWLLAIVLVPLARVIARACCRRTSAYVQNTVIIGAGDVGQLIARKLVRHPDYGINVVGFVDRWPRERRADLPGHLTILGPPERLREIIERLDVERVVISFSSEPVPAVLEMVRTLKDVSVQVDVVPRLFELVGPNGSLHMVEGMPLVGLPPPRLAPSSRLVKRLIDIVGASIALLISAPLIVWIAWRIKRDSPGPVFFRQTRLGQKMKEFSVLKFRTMKVGTDSSVHRDHIERTMSPYALGGSEGLYKLDRPDAVTKVGRWLRRTSFDELPQLFNVLRGEMSLVGPRPCIPYETEFFESYHFERFHAPPGMTGLWQVTARASAAFGEALDMDVAYVRGWSLGLDLRLLLRTPRQLLRQRKATA